MVAARSERPAIAARDAHPAHQRRRRERGRAQGAGEDRPRVFRRHLDRRADRGAIGRRPFADPDRARCGCRKLGERRFCVTGTPTDAVMMGLAQIMKDDGARPDPLGRQPRRQSRRGRHLFGHGLGGDGGRARRHPLDRAQPELCPGRNGRHRPVRRRRSLGGAGAAAADRHADGAPHPGQRQLPGARRPTRSRASGSSARACAITAASGSSSAPIRAAIIITGSASAR